MPSKKHSSFTATRSQARSPPPTEAQHLGLLRDDQDACSFTDDSIYQLSSIEVPGSAAGKRLGDLVATTTLWTSSDALGAIADLQTLLSKPADASAQRDLAKRERALASDRAAALAEVNAADHILGTRLQAPDVPALPQPHVSTG